MKSETKPGRPRRHGWVYDAVVECQFFEQPVYIVRALEIDATMRGMIRTITSALNRGRVLKVRPVFSDDSKTVVFTVKINGHGIHTN